MKKHKSLKELEEELAKKGMSIVAWDDLDEEMKKKALQTTFTCMLCGSEFTGLVCQKCEELRRLKDEEEKDSS